MNEQTAPDEVFRAQWHWFNPEPYLDALRYFTVMRHLRYLLPVLFLLALATFFKRFDWLLADMSRARSFISIVERLIMTLFAVNLVSHLVKGLTARHYGMPVPSFGMMLVFGLIPRFDMAIDTTGDKTRQQRIWLLSGSLTARAGLFSVSVFMWIVTRDSGTFLPLTFSFLAIISVITFFFLANPFMKGDGYRLLTIYLERPALRETAFRTLKSVFKPQPEVLDRHTDNKLAMHLYALSIIIFMVVVIGFIMYIIGNWLELNYRGFGVFIFMILVLTVWSSFRQRKRLQAERERKLQQRQMAAGGMAPPPATAPAVEVRRWYERWKFKGAVLVVALVIMFIPYSYEPGGEALVLPMSENQVHAETAGVIEEVFIDDGQWVDKGKVIAQLSSQRQEMDVEATLASIRKSKQEIERLRTTPLPEKRALAEETVTTARLRLGYSDRNLQRMLSLYATEDVTLEDLQAAEEEHEINKSTVIERAAILAAIESQVSPHEIAAEEAVLRGLHEDLSYYEGELEKTRLRMPSDGRVITMNLQSMINRYLDDGDLFAKVENARKVRVEVAVPEVDISRVTEGGRVRLKVWGFPHRVFVGEVVDIYPSTSDTGYGEAVPVITIIDNDAALLKSGMTGQAKIQGEEMFFVEAITRALINFVTVEMWSWLP
jgi:putative peptide zinc metalloprotease protein